MGKVIGVVSISEVFRLLPLFFFFSFDRETIC